MTKQLEHFTFSDEDIEEYNEECDAKKLYENMMNIPNILGNYEEDHFDIVAENTNDDYEINWKDISKNEKLDEQFIYNNSDKLFWPYLVKYQKLSRHIIKEFVDKINENKLWESLIEYQKIPWNVMEEYIYVNVKYWKSLVIHQKLGNTVMCHMIKHMKKNFPRKESIEFNKLIAKHQLSKNDQKKCSF